MFILKIRNFSKDNLVKTIFKINYSQFCNKSNKISFPKYARSNTSNSSIFKIFRKKTVEEIQRADNVPHPYELIYRNTMEKYLTTSRICSVASVAAVPIGLIMMEGWDTFVGGAEKTLILPNQVESEVTIYFAFLATIAVVIHSVISRMPLRIYYNFKRKDSYIFVYQTFNPLTKRYIECLRKDIEYLPGTGFMPWKDHMYRVDKSTGIFIIDNFFKTPADMHIMTGVQKPPDDDEF